MTTIAYLNQKIQRTPWIIIFLPLGLLLLGSSLHFLRGTFAVGDTAINSWGVDDAFISYRYSWNLAHFNTLSWNESGFQRTEGFTNPLWVLLGIVWSIFGNKDWVYPLSVFSSIIFSSLLFAILLLTVLKKHDYSIASILGLVSVVCVPAIWLHMTSGLESGVFGVGLAVLAYLVIFPTEVSYKRNLILMLSIFLGLLRSDSFIYLGIILIAAIIAGSSSWKPLLFGIILSSVILFTWRYLTFGNLLPNTATAKVNFSLRERIPVALIFLRSTLFNSGLFIFLLFGLAGLWLESRKIWFAGLFITLAWISYYLFIGGDVYIERHFVGLYFIMAAFSARLWIAARPKTRYLFFIVILVAGIVSIKSYGERFSYFHPKLNDPWIMLGKALELDRERYGVLLTFSAGKIPFYAGGDNIDMLGLNDPLLATLQQGSFVPGHSSGGAQAAIELASSHASGTYSTFSYLDPDFIKSPEDISLWVDNKNPQDTVQYGVSEEQWEISQSADNIFIWSIISEPTILDYPD